MELYTTLIEHERAKMAHSIVKNALGIDDDEYTKNMKKKNSKLSDEELVAMFYDKELYSEERESMRYGEVSRDWLFECFIFFLMRKITPKRFLKFNFLEFERLLGQTKYYVEPQDDEDVIC